MKDPKKQQLEKQDIIKKTRRWVNKNVINQSDMEDLIRMNEETPMSSDAFNETLKRKIRKRHLENSVYLQNLGRTWEEDFNRLELNFQDYKKRLELLRSGSDRFGKNHVTYPLNKKDVAYSILFWEQNYQKVESGKNQITLDLLLRLVAFYKVSADTILFGYHPYGRAHADDEVLSEKNRTIQDLRKLVDNLEKENQQLRSQKENGNNKLSTSTRSA